MRSGIEFVTILDDYLKNKGLSRKEFCISSGIPESTIATCKSRNVMPSVELLAKVAQFMNVSLDWLVFGEQFDDVDKEPYSRRSILDRIEIAIRQIYNVSVYDEKTLIQNYLSDIVDYEVISNWVCGKANMPERVLPEISKKLKVSLQWILTQEGNQDIDPNAFLIGLAQTYPNVLKGYNELDKEDKDFILKYIWAKLSIKRGNVPLNIKD